MMDDYDYDDRPTRLEAFADAIALGDLTYEQAVYEARKLGVTVPNGYRPRRGVR